MESYNDILNRMKQRYMQLSGFSVSEQSDIMLRFKVLAAEVLNSNVALEFVKQQMFASSATGEYLDNHATVRGLQRKKEEKAIGEVTFYVAETSLTDIVIEQGTVVSTIGAQVRQFETTQAVTLKAHELSVNAPVIAIEGGSDYNVLAKEICVMVTPPTGISYVLNEKALSGGVDRESDEQLRVRVLDSYRDISNSTNEIYYKRLVESVPGIDSSGVIARRRGPGTIDISVCAKGGAQVSSATLEKAQQLVDENRELNVDAFVIYSIPIEVRVVLGIEVEDGYSFDSIKAYIVEKSTQYIESLGVGRPMLLKEIGEIVHHTKGVKNYFFYDAYCNDVDVANNEHCVVKEIDVRLVKQ